MSSWMEVRDRIEQETNSILLTPPPEVVAIFKYNIVTSEAGSYGQAFTAMVFTAGDCRYLAGYGVNNVVHLCDRPEVSLEVLKIMFRTFVPLSAEFLGYCGLRKLWGFVQEVDAVIDTVESKEDLKEFLGSLSLYVATLSGWIQHYFPWVVGELFPHRKVEEIREMALLAGA